MKDKFENVTKTERKTKSEREKEREKKKRARERELVSWVGWWCKDKRRDRKEQFDGCC